MFLSPFWFLFYLNAFLSGLNIFCILRLCAQKHFVGSAGFPPDSDWVSTQNLLFFGQNMNHSRHLTKMWVLTVRLRYSEALNQDPRLDFSIKPIKGSLILSSHIKLNHLKQHPSCHSFIFLGFLFFLIKTNKQNNQTSKPQTIKDRPVWPVCITGGVIQWGITVKNKVYLFIVVDKT